MVMQKILPLASDIPDHVAQYVAGSHPSIRQGNHIMPSPHDYLRGMDGEPFITERVQVIYTFNKPSAISGTHIYTSPGLVKGLVDRINAGSLMVEGNIAKTERMANMDKETAIETVYTSVDIEKVIYTIKGPAMAWVNEDNTISLGASVKPHYSTPSAKAYFDGCKEAKTDVILGLFFTHVTNAHYKPPVKALDLLGFVGHHMNYQGVYEIMPRDANEYEIHPTPSYQQAVIHNDAIVDVNASVFNNKFANNILLGNGPKKYPFQPNLVALQDYAAFRNPQVSYRDIVQLVGEEVANDIARLFVNSGRFKEVLFRSEYIIIGSCPLAYLIEILEDRMNWFTIEIEANKVSDRFATMEYVCAPDVVAQYRELYKPKAPLIDVEA